METEATVPSAASSAAPHSLFDDIQALVAGTLLISLGLALLGKASLITGGTVGITFLLHYASGVSFGKLFFLINIPFYLLAWKKLGWVFTLKTFCSVLLLSLWSELLPLAFKIEHINPAYAAVMGGLLAGVGLLILFRHRASLGGVNVLVLYLQERYGWRAGYVQLALDGAITALSIPLISPSAIAMSLLGALVLNLSIAINHQPGRYVAI
ncbi:YitT family protein [Rugamonas sp. CCM 8940]|uniref:YitT family protein n=1 Tax=Rugamonas sp. CCM 8940 TaxID=2765359 RepID=UPI0018F403A4|nr:YitT family protein [Rugamonas sp. CCM 8940]MBJ7312202.1 YitT family protein [Rugamonas sp. CCM 8940]